LSFTDAATRCDSVNEIGFVHRLSWQVSLSSKGAGREHSLSEKPGGLI
jgi:hypothetical protein